MLFVLVFIYAFTSPPRAFLPVILAIYGIILIVYFKIEVYDREPEPRPVSERVTPVHMPRRQATKVIEFRTREYIHQVPAVCPTCGAALSNESVNWVGPMEAECDYCGARLETEKKRMKES
jgi:hypothetical protein